MTKDQPAKKNGSRLVKLEKIPDRIQQELDAKRVAEISRKEAYGEIRPIIHLDHDGTRVVAVGNQIHWSKNWRTFSDFLMSYPIHVLGRDWFHEESKIPEADRHPILDWYFGMVKFQRKQVPGPDGLYGCIPNGYMDAFVHLAYDLYVIRNNVDLQSKVISRLKNKDQFQGARYELFATASCIKAGFEIDYEDETDSSRKHPEFVAYHRMTNQHFAVEAKSKHRPGVLGRSGERQSDSEIEINISRILQRAYDKSPSLPYIIFIDLNLPKAERDIMDSSRFRKICESVQDGQPATPENPDPFNLLLFTNHPSNYAAHDETKCSIEYVSVFSPLAKKDVHDKNPLFDLVEVVEKYRNIPSLFPEE